MSIFGDILSKIFHTQAPASAAQPQKSSAQKPTVPAAGAAQSAAFLSNLATQKGGGGVSEVRYHNSQ